MSKEAAMRAAGVAGIRSRRTATARPAGPANVSEGLNLADLVGILRRRMWVIIVAMSVCVIASGVAYVVAKRYFPSYTSTGLIRVKMPVMEDPFARESSPETGVIQMEAENKTLYLNNEAFLTSVLKRTTVQETRWYNDHKADPAKLLNAFKSAFEAKPKAHSEFVMVTMDTPYKDESKLILEEIMTKFMIDMRDSAQRNLRSSLEALTNERVRVENQLSQKRQKMADLSRMANAPGWMSKRGDNPISAQLHTLNQEKLRLIAARNESQILLNQVIEEQNRQGVSSRVAVKVSSDPIIANFKGKIFALQEEYDRLLNRLGEEHREVREVQSSILSLEKQLANRERALHREYANALIQQLQKQLQTISNQLYTVEQQYNEVAARQSDLDRKRIDYEETEDEIDFLTARLDSFDEQINSINVSLNDPDLVRVEIAAWPTEPLSMSFPKLLYFLPAGVLLGVLLSAGICFLLENMDDSLKSPADVSRHLQVSPLGMIPSCGERGESVDLQTLAVTAEREPDSLFCEFYRQVKTDLSFNLSSSDMKTVLVTSSSAGCGKTTVACNMAITMAKAGSRVLLMDVNFHRPRLDAIFPHAQASRGLSNYLMGEGQQIDELIQKTAIEGLDVIYSGPECKNPAYLFNTDRMRECLGTLREHYDVVILDGPPALVVNDARTLAGEVDATLVVALAHKTSRNVVRRLVREMSSPRIHLLGVLLNAVRPQRGGYYQKVYQSYYEYIGEMDSQGRRRSTEVVTGKESEA